MNAPPPPAYGADPQRYQFIPRVLLIITHGERVLLVRRALTKTLWPGKYNAPGGHVERGEDPVAAAQRELHEETGLLGVALSLRGLIVAETGLSRSGILVFVYQGEGNDSELQFSSEGQPVWIRRDDLKAVDLLPDLPGLLDLTLNQPDFFYVYKTPTPAGEEWFVRIRDQVLKMQGDALS